MLAESYVLMNLLCDPVAWWDQSAVFCLVWSSIFLMQPYSSFSILMQPYSSLQRRSPEMDWGWKLWALHRRCEGWNLGHGEAGRSSQDLAIWSSFLQARRDYRQHAYRCAWLLGPWQQGEPSPGRGRTSGRGMSFSRCQVILPQSQRSRNCPTTVSVAIT